MTKFEELKKIVQERTEREAKAEREARESSGSGLGELWQGIKGDFFPPEPSPSPLPVIEPPLPHMPSPMEEKMLKKKGAWRSVAQEELNNPIQDYLRGKEPRIDRPARPNEEYEGMIIPASYSIGGDVKYGKTGPLLQNPVPFNPEWANKKPFAYDDKDDPNDFIDPDIHKLEQRLIIDRVKKENRKLTLEELILLLSPRKNDNLRDY